MCIYMHFSWQKRKRKRVYICTFLRGSTVNFALPLVEGLSECRSHRERAVWLLIVCDAVVLRDYHSIRAVFDLASFDVGLACLDARYAALFLNRTDAGDLPLRHRQHLAECLSVLRALAGGPFDNIGELQ